MTINRFFSIADKVKFLRKYITGYDAADGVRIVRGYGGNKPADRLILKGKVRNTKFKSSVFYEKLEREYLDISASLSTPFEIFRTKNVIKKGHLNKIVGIDVAPKRMKVGIVRADKVANKRPHFIANGAEGESAYYVREGLFRRYLFSFDILKVVSSGGVGYLERVIGAIPKRFERRYKMVASGGGVEFNGTFVSVRLLVRELSALAMKYDKDISNGTFINRFVVYAFDPRFIDLEALGHRIDEYSAKREFKASRRYR